VTCVSRQAQLEARKDWHSGEDGCIVQALKVPHSSTLGHAQFITAAICYICLSNSHLAADGSRRCNTRSPLECCSMKQPTHMIQVQFKATGHL